MSPFLRVALATAPHLPDLTADDRLLLDELRDRGVDADPAVWDAPRDWAADDAVVVRSCWDTHLRRHEFLAWVRQLGATTTTRLVNPAPMLAWNTDKRYLRELAAAGVRVAPTVWVSAAGRAPGLAALLDAEGWEQAVVKPAVSAGAYETWRTTAADAAADDDRFAALVGGAHGAVLVQPFLDEVLDEGEWSLIFVAGRFSHAVLKRPAPGDFRVQPQHGGRTERAEPPAALVDDAESVLRAAARATGVRPAALLYARVDGIVQDGRLVLMELECVEPNLFLAHAPGAAARLADALIADVAPRRR